MSVVKKVGYTLLVSVISNITWAQVQPGYKNSALPVEQRVRDLLSRMTVEEKAGQLNLLTGDLSTGPESGNVGWDEKLADIRKGKVGAMLNVIGTADTRKVQEAAVKSRLGIPLIFGYDMIHGYKTIFPIPLAEACCWDLEQITANARVMAMETASAGVHWTFAPMCDISNDPRWGRVMEGIGEDPWYGALVSEARMKGLQGNLDNNHILACVKHFATYGAVEGGKEYNYTDMSREVLWNKYLPPYKAAVGAGAATVMNGFTTFEGIPVTANKYLVTEVLKNKWKFSGFLVSDWNSIGEMVNWGYASSGKDAAEKAMNAGSMMDMETRAMIKYVPRLVKEGKIMMKELDDAVGRILYYKFKLGLFDNPYAYSDELREKTNLFTSDNRKKALDAAERSIVLLKNEQQLLPLKKEDNKKIALIGLYAGSKEDMFDFWCAQGNYNDAVSLREGMENVFGKDNISFSLGYNADNSTDTALINKAVVNALKADVIVVNIGLSGKLAGEDRSLASPEIPDGQIELLRALKKTGRPIVAVVSAGRPLILTKTEGLCDAIVYSWLLGTESGNAIAQVLSGGYNPSAKTVMSFPYATGQIQVYYNHYSTGRPTTTDGKGNWYSRYLDIPNEPLYPFGYGLSYTSFTYSNLSLNKNVVEKGEPLQIKVTVTNNGNYDGEEVVQLYIHDIAASIIRPVKELKGFQKVLIPKCTSKTIEFTLADKELSFYDAEGNIVLEPGKFDVFVGGNSRDVLKSSFELK